MWKRGVLRRAFRRIMSRRFDVFPRRKRHDLGVFLAWGLCFIVGSKEFMFIRRASILRASLRRLLKVFTFNEFSAPRLRDASCSVWW